MTSRNVPPERSKATAAARGFWLRTSDKSIAANPCSAFVTSPSEVAISVGSAKKARKASDMPSNSTRGRGSVAASANELTFQYLLSDVAHASASAHRRLLDDLEGRRLVESALAHQDLLGALDDLARFDL